MRVLLVVMGGVMLLFGTVHAWRGDYDHAAWLGVLALINWQLAEFHDGGSR